MKIVDQKIMEKRKTIMIRISEQDRKALNVKTAKEGTTIQEVLYTAIQAFISRPSGK